MAKGIEPEGWSFSRNFFQPKAECSISKSSITLPVWSTTMTECFSLAQSKAPNARCCCHCLESFMVFCCCGLSLSDIHVLYFFLFVFCLLLEGAGPPAWCRTSPLYIPFLGCGDC